MRIKFAKGYQKLLIKNFLNRNKLSLREATKILRCGKTTLRHWINEENTISEKVLKLILQITPELETFEKHILKKLPDNWGKIKGGKERIRRIKNVSKYTKYLRELKNKKRKIISDRHKKKLVKSKVLQKILEDKIDLHCFLTTCLLTDGSVSINDSNFRICFYTKDLTLKNLAIGLLSILSEYYPNITKDKKGVYAIRISDKNLGKKLLTLAQSFKKKPSKGQFKKNYLKELQPSLKFLQKCDERTYSWCIRLAFTTDGCISLSKNTYELNLRCFHPFLCKEWIKILKKCEVRGHIKNDKKSWCGVGGVRIYDKKSILNFWKMGGFISGVKTSNKSKYFKGLEKNKVLKTLIERWVGNRAGSIFAGKA